MHKAWIVIYKYVSSKGGESEPRGGECFSLPPLKESLTRDPAGELQFETRIGRSLIRHCVRILQVFIYIAIWYTTMPDNKIHVPYDCIHVHILHTKRWLYRQRYIVLHDILQFQLIVSGIIKIIRRGTIVPLHEFAAKQPKKKHKLGV